MKKSKFAVVSLVLGIFSFVHLFGLEKAALAIIFGFVALNEISQEPELKGKRFAWIGIVLGTIAAILTITLVSIKFPKFKELLQKIK